MKRRESIVALGGSTIFRGYRHQARSSLAVWHCHWGVPTITSSARCRQIFFRGESDIVANIEKPPRRISGERFPRRGSFVVVRQSLVGPWGSVELGSGSFSMILPQQGRSRSARRLPGPWSR